MRILKCYFCSSDIYPGHGITYVRNDCKVFNFCRSKCHKLFKARKNPRKIKWTKASRAARGKEMINDPVLEFEKRRDRPVRYNRNLWVSTIQAMKRIDEIREARKKRFWRNRIRDSMKKKEQDLITELKKDITLIENPALKNKIQEKLKEKEKQEEEKQELMEIE